MGERFRSWPVFKCQLTVPKCRWDSFISSASLLFPSVSEVRYSLQPAYCPQVSVMFVTLFSQLTVSKCRWGSLLSSSDQSITCFWFCGRHVFIGQKQHRLLVLWLTCFHRTKASPVSVADMFWADRSISFNWFCDRHVFIGSKHHLFLVLWPTCFHRTKACNCFCDHSRKMSLL